MKVLPKELWTQVFQDMGPLQCAKLMTTCRLFHSLLEAQLYADVRISRSVHEEKESFYQKPQSPPFVRTLTGRPELFRLVRSLELHSLDHDDVLDREMMPEINYWSHPVLRQLPCFPRLRHLILEDIHIDILSYTAIRAIPRLERLEVQYCDIDADALDLQPFQGNTISTLSIDRPKCGEGWAALFTPGIHTLIMTSTIEDVHMAKVLRGILSCDLRRTLTTLEWNLDDEFYKRTCRLIVPCVQLESLSITYRIYPRDEVGKRSSHYDNLPPGSLPKLSKFGGSAEHAATILTGRSVHSVSLQLWEDTPKDVLLALQLSKVPITKLELSQNEYEDSGNGASPTFTALYLDHIPEKIETLSLHEKFDKEKLQSWIPALSKLSNLQSIECNPDLKDLTQIEVVQLISDACPSIRKIFFKKHEFDRSWGEAVGKWMWRNDGSWEYYPVES